MDKPRYLYIIGNGFDLHHGIKSSYRNFRNWLNDTYPDLLNDIENVYGDCEEDWWSDFENNLASSDVICYASRIAFENSPDLLSDHCDRTWDEAQIVVEQNLEKLYLELRECFCEWILQLNPPEKDKMLDLHRKDTCFLTFNYTKTLEELYNIPSSQILHIHGCVGCNENLILGHGKSYEDLEKMNVYDIPDPPQSLPIEEYEAWSTENTKEFHEQLAEEAALQGIVSQQKPVGGLIHKYSVFFDSISSVEEVFVYGISFSKVDEPYLKKVASVLSNAHWFISYYEKTDRCKIMDFVYKNNIENYSIIMLDDMVNRNQLRLQFIY